jgi:glycosyltransferase involved in cell wall biosynthesis
MPRLAWFSPMPPVATGVATCSADLVAALGAGHEIDVFVDEPVARVAPGTRSAHEFVWRHHRRPYDLTVYQLGNSSHHDYQWPYLFRYPGLTVLHDVHLHHARAAALMRSRRAADYRVELAWNHPDANPDLAELAIGGFDSHLYYDWPMTRLVARASRLVAVHTEALAIRLRADVPEAAIAAVALGHGTALSPDEAAAAGRRARAQHGIAPDAMLVGCFGGLSPDKRIPQVLAAIAAVRPLVPQAHLLLAGEVPQHYDLRADIERHGLTNAVTVTGYLASDAAFTDAIAACDVALNLRWPTAREVSGPWLRSLAAGRATVIMDLAHLTGVPTIDPRTWRAATTEAPCAVAIDILDEDHSLRLALRRLGTDRALRDALGRAARAYWQEHHSIATMVEGYRGLIAAARQRPAATVELPAHLRDDGGGALDRLLEPFGLPSPLPASR